ncbi:MAG: phosphotransferase [Candidatus Howiella sp.]|jgi:uncharacterized protein (TIGR02172 family)
METLQNYFLSYKPYISLLIAAALIFVWIGLRKFVKKQFIQKGPHDRKEGHIQLALNAVKYMMTLIAFVVILNINGVNVSSITTGLGIAGIVVGFALQDALQDWIAGIGIVWDKYFSVGDIVKYKEYEGKVLKFNFKCTKIKDVNTGSLIVISNRHLSEIELTADWFELNVPGPLDIPAAHMREVFAEIAKRMEQKEGCNSCRLLGTEEFTDYCAMNRFSIGCDETIRGDMQRALNDTVQDVYNEQNIPFDVVKVGDQFASVFELLSAKSFSKLIKAEPEKADYYIGLFVELLKQIHSTEVKPEDMPDIKAVALDWADFLKDHLPQEQANKLYSLIESVPDRYTMIHGDYHTNNVEMQNGEVLLIDMDTLSHGHPVFELASMFLGFVAFGELDHNITLKFMGLPYEITTQIWKKSLALYLGTEDASVIRAVEQKAQVIGYARLLRRTIRREADTEHGKRQIALCKEKLSDLLGRVKSLNF